MDDDARPNIWLSELKLSAFRNYASLSTELSSKHIVLTGSNGAGKTNFMEAISLLSPGRGLRRAALADMKHKDSADGFSVFATLINGSEDYSIGTGTAGNEPSVAPVRRVRINGTTVKSADELSDLCRVIWVTPSMDGLFTGSTSDRRRFTDRMVLAIDPTHGRRVTNYEKAMRNRNRLLDEPANQQTDSWLDAAESQLASLGTAIVMARYELICLLTDLIHNNGNKADGAFPTAHLALEGELEALAAEGLNGFDLEESFARQLRDMRFRDRAAKRTLIGPHRADLLVHHVEKDIAASLCSTGEQKALLIGLVLAHAVLTRSISKMAPFMLLDEVAAHLDINRRAALRKMEKLSESEIERYARHIILPEFGGAGQQKIKSAKVCIIGAGGLGSPALLYLAAAGVGTLGIVDDDVVSLSNLQRQIIHATHSVGETKTHSAANTIDHTAEKLQLPLIAGALGRFEGSLTVLKPYVDNNPRYRDIFPKPPPEGVVPSCAEAGVLGALAGVIGSLQAVETVKLITAIGKPLIGELLLYNALETRFDRDYDLMKRFFKFTSLALVLLVVGLLGYGAYGYFDARSEAEKLQARANDLLMKNLGGSSLGEERYRQLLAVQDPTFEQHNGVDMTTPGAGITTVTQSLAKRVGFDNFTPGIGKLRQTGYALGLEGRLSKEQIMALWLDTLEMGRGPDGWVTGFHRMSDAVYGTSPDAITDDQYFSLLAVLISPGRYKLGSDDEALRERTGRISRLVTGTVYILRNIIARGLMKKLTPELMGECATWLAIVSQLYTTRMNTLLADHGMTLSQFSILHHLASPRMQGGSRISDIANAVEVGQPAVTKTIAKFQNMGLVELIDGTKDKRVRHVQPLPKAAETVSRIRQAMGPDLFSVFSAIDDDPL
ncbi:DNA replication and repair protein RecF [Nymphon striatum]|nr:DNA replication and repair protein RecF [Nymphon striatum]